MLVQIISLNIDIKSATFKAEQMLIKRAYQHLFRFKC